MVCRRMAKLIIIVIFLHIAAIVRGQAEIKNYLSNQQVATLHKALNTIIEDSIRVNILLRLAKYHFEKSNEKSDLDSASTFISSAKAINARQTSGKRTGLILLYEAYLARKSGNAVAGRQLVNQAIRQIQALNDEFHLAEAYLELTWYYDPNDPKQVVTIRNVFNTLFQRAPKLIIPEHRDSCMSVLLNFYLLHLNYDSYSFTVKLDFLDHLVRSYQMLNNKILEFWSRKEIADIHYKQGQLSVAINELLQIAKEQEAGSYPGVCFTYDLLSGLYFAGARTDKALYYSLQAIKSVSVANDSIYLARFYERVSFNYSRSGSIAEAVEWSLKSLDYRIDNKQTDGLYILLYDLTGDLIKLSKPAEALDLILSKKDIFPVQSAWEQNYLLLSLAMCYAALNKNLIAGKYCEELIELNELRIKRGEIASNVILNQFLANFYFDNGQYGKAEKYFNKTMNEWPKSGGDLGQSFKSHFLFKLDSARGNYISAIKHLRNYQVIKDSMLTVTKTKQIEDLKIAYATEQKDSLINLKEQNIRLLTRQDELQKSKLQQGAILRNISFGLATLLIIIVALLYNRFRLKQRTNRRLELQQTEIAKQNASLNDLVSEKDWLVKEIHHRVKNNLQIVMSLLNSQSAYIDNEPALTAIHDSQHRVYAMSLIHQKLYNTENLSSIDMSLYIQEMASYLADSFNTGQRIRFELAIESLEMDVSQAVPLGLILNEAITNSIKYAFPNDREGVIKITLSNKSGNQYLLEIADNGIGIPSHLENVRAGSLGMSLMAGLSEDLDGIFSIENNNGTIIRTLFVYDISVKRPDALAPSFVISN
jgi:two-component system, sensor histidine kinase PdtaS